MQSEKTTASNFVNNVLGSQSGFDNGGFVPSMINEPMFRNVSPIVGAVSYTANSLGIKN